MARDQQAGSRGPGAVSRWVQHQMNARMKRKFRDGRSTFIDAGKTFPVHALADALLAAYNPHTTGSGLRWGDLAVLAAWGAAGLIIAVRRFSWLPRVR
jgi:hypothetical protein